MADINTDLVNGHRQQRDYKTNRKWEQFKLVKGRNDPATFYLLVRDQAEIKMLQLGIETV